MVSDVKGDPLGIPDKSILSSLLTDLNVYSHLNQNPIKMRRFSDTSNAEIKKLLINSQKF